MVTQLEAEPLFQSVPVLGSIKLTVTVVPTETAIPWSLMVTELTVMLSAVAAAKVMLPKSSLALRVRAETAPKEAAVRVSLLRTTVMS